MFGALLSNAIDHIGVTEELIDAHEAFIKSQPAERQSLYKLYAVTSCVTRLYAIYEHFMETLVADYLDAIPELIPYSDLSTELKAEYRRGISHILNKLDGERYGHLKHENVIGWYHEALTSQGRYRFVVEALTRHEQNLRLPEVERLAARVDLKGLRTWLSHSAEVINLYEEHTAVAEQLEAELRAFIQTRNDAAHGVLETLEGKDLLLRYCVLIRSVARTVAAYFHRGLLEQRAKSGRMKCIGAVTEVFPKSGAFIAKIAAGQTVQLGLQLHLVGKSYCELHQVESLRMDDVSVSTVVTVQDDTEVGIKCAVVPRRKTQIFIEA